jgi:hypothetical protein
MGISVTRPRLLGQMSSPPAERQSPRSRVNRFLLPIATGQWGTTPYVNANSRSGGSRTLNPVEVEHLFRTDGEHPLRVARPRTETPLRRSRRRRFWSPSIKAGCRASRRAGRTGRRTRAPAPPGPLYGGRGPRADWRGPVRPHPGPHDLPEWASAPRWGHPARDPASGHPPAAAGELFPRVPGASEAPRTGVGVGDPGGLREWREHPDRRPTGAGARTGGGEQEHGVPGRPGARCPHHGLSGATTRGPLSVRGAGCPLRESPGRGPGLPQGARGRHRGARDG